MKTALLLSLLVLSAQAKAPKPSPCWGSTNGVVYHTDRECPAFKRIKPKNLRCFKSPADGVKAGRHLCKACEGRK